MNARRIMLAGILAVQALVLSAYVPTHAQPDRGTRIAKRQEMSSEKRVALVIGNGGYASSPLRNPANDARAMAAALRSCGFDVSEEIDCSRREMLAAIRAFGRQLGQGGVGLFYYAGHGLQVKGQNYLVPVDAEVRFEDEVADWCVEASSVLRKMESAGNRVNIVVMDACRNNPFARSFRSATRGLARMDAPKGSYIAYATAPGSVASDGSDSNGLYTAALLDAMRLPGLKIEEVFKRVRTDVLSATSEVQIPWESSSLTGDFYFALADQQVTAVPSAVAPAPSAPPPPPTPVLLGHLQVNVNAPNAAPQRPCEATVRLEAPVRFHPTAPRMVLRGSGPRPVRHLRF